MYAIFHSSSVLRYFFNLLVKPIIHICFFETEHFFAFIDYQSPQECIERFEMKKELC